MKKFSIRILPMAIFAFLLFSISPVIASGELEIGEEAPAQKVKMKDISGKEMSLTDLKAKNGLLVVFTCNTCPWVLAWEGRYNEISDLAMKNGIKMVGINSNEAYRDGDDSMKAMKEHAKKQGYKFPYLVDENSTLADAFGATKTPHIFLFDKNMKLVYRGAIDDNAKNEAAVTKPYLKNAMQDLVDGKEIEPKTTRSLGCSIKRKAS